MKGKGSPFYFDLEILFQFFNTPGTEITPGSDVIRKDFKGWIGSHFSSRQNFCVSIFYCIAGIGFVQGSFSNILSLPIHTQFKDRFFIGSYPAYPFGLRLKLPVVNSEEKCYIFLGFSLSGTGKDREFP
jgi:hypothetical protein